MRHSIRRSRLDLGFAGRPCRPVPILRALLATSTTPTTPLAREGGYAARLMRGRLSYANIVASLALFVALGGTSYAVIKLPKDSVGSREVKNGSLKPIDVSSSLRGSKRGPRGAEGPAGGLGPRGPSDILTTIKDSVPLGLGGPSSVDVVTLNVPVGSWWVLGSATVVYEGAGAAGSTYFRCSLAFGADAGAARSAGRVGTDAGASLAAVLTVHEGHVLSAPTAVRLRCGHDETLPSGTPRVDHAQLTAIKTDKLEIQPG